MACLEICTSNKLRPLDFINQWFPPEENKMEWEDYLPRNEKSCIEPFAPTGFAVFNRSESSPLKNETEMEFGKLSKEWEDQTAFLSSIQAKICHPAYLSILALGKQVVPFILKQLQKKPDFWFPALRAITKENPVHSNDVGNLRKMTEAWLQWGVLNSFLNIKK